MTEFDNLKRNYISAIQFGMLSKISYQEAKQGNDILHWFCEKLVENSNYNDVEKFAMKQELEILKKSLSEEIKEFYIKPQ